MQVIERKDPSKQCIFSTTSASCHPVKIKTRKRRNNSTSLAFALHRPNISVQTSAFAGSRPIFGSLDVCPLSLPLSCSLCNCTTPLTAVPSKLCTTMTRVEEYLTDFHYCVKLQSTDIPTFDVVLTSADFTPPLLSASLSKSASPKTRATSRTTLLLLTPVLTRRRQP